MEKTQRTRSAKQSAIFGVLSSLIAAGGAIDHAVAEEWRITPSLTVEESYNTNSNRDFKGREKADYITSISPGVAVRGDGRRVKLNFDYDPQQLIFVHQGSQDTLRQRFRGFGQVEALEQFLFLDAEASVDQQFVNSTGAVGSTTLTTNNNLATVQNYSFGPIFRNHFGNFADSEVRYHYLIFTSDSSAVADTTTHDVGASLRSGRTFTELAWQLNGGYTTSDRSGGGQFSGTSTERTRIKLDTQYALNSMFSLLAGAGYDQIKDPTLFNTPGGPVWDVGFQVRPNSVSRARFTFGERYDKPNFGVDVDYSISESIRFNSRYARSIETSQTLQGSSLNEIGVDSAGRLVNLRTGQPFLPGDPAFGLTNQAFRQDRAELGVSISSGRNGYSLQAFREERSFDLVNTNDSNSIGVTLNWTRKLTPLLTFDLGGSYTRTEFPNLGSRKDDYYTGLASLSYQLSQTAKTRLSYRRTDRESNAANSDIVEDVVTIGISKTF